MRLATTTGDLWGYTGSQEASMQHIREAGFRYMDYNFGCDYGNRSGVYSEDYLSYFDRISRAVERLDAKLVQAHSPMGKPLAEDNAAFIADTLRCVEACGAWGIPNLVVHSGYTPGLTVEQTYEQNKRFYAPLLECAEKYGVPLLTTKARTSHVMAGMITWLNTQLAPRTTRHGVFVEVYGEGILLLGDSGIGKSETAIELVKRGHRLIADDAVEIKRVSDKKLIGSAPDLIKHYVELRGIGIVDVRRIFGMGAVKEVEQIDLVINLEKWIDGKMYDRFGLQSETTDILGVNVTSATIPVTPGRNMAIIIEIAAMNNKQKKMGYNTAEEFNKRLMAQLENKD